MRLTLAALVAAGVGALGAVILGEYPYQGAVVLASGVVLGLFIAEAALAVHRQPGLLLAALCAAVGLAAMTWGAWITTGHDLSFLGPAGWTSVVLTGAAAGLRTAGIRGLWSRRAAGTPARTAPAAPSEDSRP